MSPAQNPRPNNLRISCSSLPFTDRPLAETLTRIERLGFSGWELAIRGDRVHLGHLDPEDLVSDSTRAETICQVQRDHPGLPCVGAGFEVARTSSLERELELFTQCCALLQKLSAPAVTLFIYDDGAAPLAERYAAMQNVAKTYGLRARVETHLHTATADPARALAWCRELGLELTLDASHYIVQGLSLSRYSPLFPYVGAVQIRACAPGQMQLHAEHFNRELLIPEGFSGDIIVEYIDRDVLWDTTLTTLCATLKTC